MILHYFLSAFWIFLGSQESPLSGDNESGGSIGIYAGAAGGALAVIAIATAVILLLRKRYITLYIQ